MLISSGRAFALFWLILDQMLLNILDHLYVFNSVWSDTCLKGSSVVEARDNCALYQAGWNAESGKAFKAQQGHICMWWSVNVVVDVMLERLVGRNDKCLVVESCAEGGVSSSMHLSERWAQIHTNTVG